MLQDYTTLHLVESTCGWDLMLLVFAVPLFCVIISCTGFTAVPYYTAITFKTSWSFLVGLFRAHIVVKLFGSNGESNFVQLQRYLCFSLNCYSAKIDTTAIF